MSKLKTLTFQQQCKLANIPYGKNLANWSQFAKFFCQFFKKHVSKSLVSYWAVSKRATTTVVVSPMININNIILSMLIATASVSWVFPTLRSHKRSSSVHGIFHMLLFVITTNHCKTKHRHLLNTWKPADNNLDYTEFY